MRRVVVLGGGGFFGGAVVEALREEGIQPEVRSRRSGLDAEDPASIRGALHRGDVVVDAAGPFHARSTALLEAAIEVGFDLVDLSDSLPYAERVLAARERIERAGIAVLTACSAVSAVTAALVSLSGVRAPTRVVVLLAPASRHTANAGVLGSLLASVGRRIRVRAGGHLVERVGGTRSRRFSLPPPMGTVRGFLQESADAVLLTGPEDVEMYVSTRRPTFDALLSVAARLSLVRALLHACAPVALPLVRRLGRTDGGLAVEVAGADGRTTRVALVGGRRSHLTAAVPAALAAKALAEGRFPYRGLVPPHLQLDPAALLDALQRRGIQAVRTRASIGLPTP